MSMPRDNTLGQLLAVVIILVVVAFSVLVAATADWQCPCGKIERSQKS